MIGYIKDVNSLVIWKTKLSGMLGGHVKRGSTVYPGNKDIELTPVYRNPEWRVRHAVRNILERRPQVLSYRAT